MGYLTRLQLDKQQKIQQIASPKNRITSMSQAVIGSKFRIHVGYNPYIAYILHLSTSAEVTPKASLVRVQPGLSDAQ